MVVKHRFKKRPAACRNSCPRSVFPGFVWTHFSHESKIEITNKAALTESVIGKLLNSNAVEERRRSACTLQQLEMCDEVDEAMYAEILAMRPIVIENSGSVGDSTLEYCRSCEHAYKSFARVDSACVKCGD